MSYTRIIKVTLVGNILPLSSEFQPNAWDEQIPVCFQGMHADNGTLQKLCYLRSDVIRGLERFDRPHWRIQEFTLGGGGPNQDPQSKVEGEARIEGAKRPSIEGEVRVEGAKRPRIEGEARTEGEAQEKAGGGVWGGGSVSPSPENF